MRGRHVAVVGSGVAGLTAAYVASHSARVTLFEADDRLGRHRRHPPGRRPGRRASPPATWSPGFASGYLDVQQLTLERPGSGTMAR